MSPDVSRAEDSLLVSIGDAVDKARKAQGLTIAAIARRSGLSKRALQYGRSCSTDPKLSTLLALSKALGYRLVIRFERSEDHP